MNKDTLLSILRHLLTFGGGFVVAKGYLSESLVTQLIGAVPAAVGWLWGAVDEYRAWKKASAEGYKL